MKKDKIKLYIILLVLISLSTTLSTIAFSSNSTLLARSNQVLKLSDDNDNSSQIEENENTISEYQSKINELEVSRTKEFQSNGFSDKYYEIAEEISTLQDKISKLKEENMKLQSESFINEIMEDDDTYESDVSANSPKKSFSPFNIMFIFVIIFIIIVVVIFIIIFVGIIKSKNTFHKITDIAIEKNKQEEKYVKFVCPNCGATLDGERDEIKECKYCGSKLYKTMK